MNDPERSFRVWDCQELLQMRCPRSWDALDETSNTDVRHCRSCDKDVYLCGTPADFVSHGELGRCLAIPDDLSPGLGLGEPSPEAILRGKAIADRGTVWWEDVVLRQAALSTEPKEVIQAARKRLAEFNSLYSQEHLAVLRRAVQADGFRCPNCGFDIAEDHFGVMIFLGTRRCERCQAPIDLELPPA